ncbi:MAG: DUF4101 domain-containing protein [Candidatus Melainabacteria bacterium]|nr:DUF4101 domain-containing protein [Candidatus Melainabacteria bacterium]
MRRRDFTTALSLTVISSFMACGAAFAADPDPSLDQMWTDPAVTEKKAASAATEAPAQASSGSAPLCSVDSLRQSALIKTGGWPGIGPFKGDGNEYVDAGQNRLKLESSKDKITSAELRLTNQNKNTAIFNLEMSADFLLESLGAKEARISDFNGQLEKSRSQLLQSSEASPLNLSAGSYLVYMHPEVDKASADKYSFVIKVSSKDASSDLIKRHSSGQVASANPPAATDTTTENGWETTKTTTTKPATSTPTTTRTTISSTPGLNFGIETPKTTIVTTPKTTPTKIASTAPPRTTTTTRAPETTTPETEPATPDEASAPSAPVTLKDTFREVIFGWQKLKKVAVRQRDTSELSTVLSGRALVRQSDAIKWLQTNKKYYDMNPKSVVVDRYTETIKGQKYAVYAQVKESSKYMDEPTGQVIKDSEDTYNVNYTIEKSGDKWLISDSAIVTQPNKSTTKTR